MEKENQKEPQQQQPPQQPSKAEKVAKIAKKIAMVAGIGVVGYVTYQYIKKTNTPFNASSNTPINVEKSASKSKDFGFSNQLPLFSSRPILTQWQKDLIAKSKSLNNPKSQKQLKLEYEKANGMGYIDSVELPGINIREIVPVPKIGETLIDNVKTPVTVKGELIVSKKFAQALNKKRGITAHINPDVTKGGLIPEGTRDFLPNIQIKFKRAHAQILTPIDESKLRYLVVRGYKKANQFANSNFPGIKDVKIKINPVNSKIEKYIDTNSIPLYIKNDIIGILKNPSLDN